MQDLVCVHLHVYCSFYLLCILFLFFLCASILNVCTPQRLMSENSLGFQDMNSGPKSLEPVLLLTEPSCTPPKQSLSLNLKLKDIQIDWLSTELRGCTTLCLPSADDLNSTPHRAPRFTNKLFTQSYVIRVKLLLRYSQLIKFNISISKVMKTMKKESLRIRFPTTPAYIKVWKKHFSLISINLQTNSYDIKKGNNHIYSESYKKFGKIL